MTISNKIDTMMARQSWIREMFKQGVRLKAEYGAKNVFDFSLGNPNVPPPDQFTEVLIDLVSSSKGGAHGYMANTGYPFVQQLLADYLSQEHQVPLTENNTIMTCGAAGAFNANLKAIIDQGDEVISIAPYFVEYNSFADNHGGILKTVSTRPDFTLNLEAIAKAISEKTKAIYNHNFSNIKNEVDTIYYGLSFW